jgi:hypothetical protein
MCVVGVRRRPTLPHPAGCSTIGAGGLSFRVRYVAGRFPSAVAAVTVFVNQVTDTVGGCGCLLVGVCIVDAVVCGQVLGLLVPVN